MKAEWWLAILPTLALAVAIGVAIWQPWKHPGGHQAPVIGRPVPAHPRPAEHDGTTTLVGSMDLVSERAWQHRAELRPELAGLAEVLNYPPRAFACQECGAPDFEPHYPACSYYEDFAEPGPELAPFAFVPVLPVEARAGTLHPSAWRPFLTAAEWAELFPGVPYGPCPDPGPHTGDVLVAVDPGHADQLAQLDAEHAEWIAQRAQAHLTLRASMRAAWQALAFP